VRILSETFYDASSFNGDLSSWNVTSMTDLYATFNGASSFNRDLSSWNRREGEDSVRNLL